MFHEDLIHLSFPSSTRSSTSDLSPLESVLPLLIALERGSLEIEGALPVDHTSTIKSVRAYKTREVFSFSLRNIVPLPGDLSLFYNYCNILNKYYLLNI